MGKALERAIDDRFAHATMIVRERLRLEAVDAEICEAIRVVRLQILNKKAELDELRGRGGKKTRQAYYDSAADLVQAIEKLLVKKAAVVKALANVRRDEDGVEADIAMLFKDTPDLCPPKYAGYLSADYDNGLRNKSAVAAQTDAVVAAIERGESGVSSNLEDAFDGAVPSAVLASFAEEDHAADAQIKRMAVMSTKDWMEGGKGCVTGMGTASGKGGPNSHPHMSVIDAVTAYGQDVDDDLDAHFAVYDASNAHNGAVLGNADDVAVVDDKVDRAWLPLRSQIVDVVASNTVLSTHLIVAEEEKETVRKAHNKIIATLNTTRAQNRLLRVYAGPDAVKVCEDEAEREVALIAPTYKTVSGLYLESDVRYDVNNVWADGVQWDAAHDNGHYVYTGVDDKESNSLLTQNMQHIVSSMRTAPLSPRAHSNKDEVEVGDKYIAGVNSRTTTPHRTREDPFTSPRSISRASSRTRDLAAASSMEFGNVSGSFSQTPARSRAPQTPRSEFTTPHAAATPRGAPTTPRGAPTTPRGMTYSSGSFGSSSFSNSALEATTPRGARSRSASRSALSSHAIFNSSSAPAPAPAPVPATTTPRRQREVAPISPTSRLLAPKTPSAAATHRTTVPVRTPTTALRHTRTTIATASAASTPKASNPASSLSGVRSPTATSRGRTSTRTTAPVTPKTANITNSFVVTSSSSKR